MNTAIPFLDEKDLKKLEPLDTLSADGLHALAREFSIEHVLPGRLLFKLGDQNQRTLYLLSGEVLLSDDDGFRETIRAGTERARQPIIYQQPRPIRARATVQVTVLGIDSKRLSTLMHSHQPAAQGFAETPTTVRPMATSGAAQAQTASLTAGNTAEEIARLLAETEAAKREAELAAAKVREELEARAQKEIGATQARLTEEAQRAETAERARREAELEMARLQAETEAARLKAELAAAKAREESEARVQKGIDAANVRLREEARRTEAAERARREAEEEMARLRAEAEAARQQAEQEAQRSKQAQPTRRKVSAEQKEARHDAQAHVQLTAAATETGVGQRPARRPKTQAVPQRSGRHPLLLTLVAALVIGIGLTGAYFAGIQLPLIEEMRRSLTALPFEPATAPEIYPVSGPQTLSRADGQAPPGAGEIPEPENTAEFEAARRRMEQAVREAAEAEFARLLEARQAAIKAPAEPVSTMDSTAVPFSVTPASADDVHSVPLSPPLTGEVPEAPATEDIDAKTPGEAQTTETIDREAADQDME